MNHYLVPTATVLELPPEPTWAQSPESTIEGFVGSIEKRSSSRHFQSQPLSPKLLDQHVLQHLAEVQRETPGIRFVCALNSGPHQQDIWTLSDGGTLVDPYTPTHWVDLFLQEEFASAPFVAVAVIETDCTWRKFEHQMVASTAALSRVWLRARMAGDGIEGSIFAGVLAGWLRSTSRISSGESTGVALALGYPAQPFDAN